MNEEELKLKIKELESSGNRMSEILSAILYNVPLSIVDLINIKDALEKWVSVKKKKEEMEENVY